jgi:transglutaminase-like putative cysteine protease
MVTLLRIQGIPARKVTGFLISADANLQPTVGQVFNFQASSSGTSEDGFLANRKTQTTTKKAII